ETIVWYGQVKHKPGQFQDDKYFKARWELSDAAFYGKWPHVIDILETRQRYFGETWANCWRIPKAPWMMWGDAPRGYTVLHQAAYHGASEEVVQKLIDLGAWRLARTLHLSKESAAHSTPRDIARDRGATHLLDILTPVIKRPVSAVVLRDLEELLHGLIRKSFADHHSAHLDCFVLPSLEPLLEFRSAKMWFPLDPEESGPGPRGIGVEIGMSAQFDELEVEICVGKVVRRTHKYRISMHGVQSVNE
ncbi:hypothetical protein QBC39DRAFT_396677, partial [Podospora conica]